MSMCFNDGPRIYNDVKSAHIYYLLWI